MMSPEEKGIGDLWDDLTDQDSQRAMSFKEKEDKKIKEIIETFTISIKGMADEAIKECASGKRESTGGGVRAKKANVCPCIVKEVVKLAWEKVGGDPKELRFGGEKITLPIDPSFVETLKYEKVRQGVKKNIKNFCYQMPPDALIYIGEGTEPKICLEYKAYTENAQLKRILFDFSIARAIYPHLQFFVMQLESSLGGDYSELKGESETIGSVSTMSILSWAYKKFKVTMRIFTFLEGERNIKRRIDKKPEFFKPLTRDILICAIGTFAEVLKPYVRKCKK